MLTKKTQDIHISSANALMLKLVDCPDDVQRGTLKALIGCSAKCPCARFKVLEHGNLETVHMIPKADTNFGFASHQEYVSRSGYMIGNGITTNKRFTLIGYMHPDPNNQKATYLFDQAIPEKDLLDELEITPELLAELSLFQCAEGQTVAEKFEEIHADLER